MKPAEHPQHSPAKALPAAAEREPYRLDVGVKHLRRLVGMPPAPLPKDADDAEMEKRLIDMTKDGAYDDLSELHRTNEFIYKRAALQRQADKESPERTAAFDARELVAANQAATYFEYFPSVLRHVLSISDKCTAVRQTIDGDLPPALAAKDLETRAFLDELGLLSQRRLDFANASLVAKQLAAQPDRQAPAARALAARLQELNANLDAAGQAALIGPPEALRVHASAQDQRLVDLLAVKSKLPSLYLLELLTYRYTLDVERHKALLTDPQQAEFRALSERNELAKRGKGDALSDAEGKRFEELQRLFAAGNATIDTLRKRRTETVQGLVDTTQQLGEYQLEMSELSTIQHQFRAGYGLEGAPASARERTPENVRTAIDEVMAERQKFHVDRTDAFLGRFQEEVLSIGLREQVEDFSNKTGREVLRNVSNSLASFFTLPVPEALGLRDGARQYLAGPLNEAMGWPADKMDLTFGELAKEDPAAAQRVMQKMKSVKDAIELFDEGTIVNMKSTIETIRGMPPAKSFVGEAALDPLPDLGERITPKNRDALIAKYGGPTVYVMLFRQLENDWGTSDPPDGFFGNYATFLQSMNENVDVHLDVGGALLQMSDRWMKLAYLLAGVLATMIGVKAYRTIRSLLPRGSRNAPASAPSAAPARAAAETVEEFANPRALQEAIDAARQAKNYEKVGELLTKNRAMLEAAAEAGDDEAKAILKALQFASESRWFARLGATLAVLGVLFDAYLLYANEQEIAKAKADNNAALVEILESKRISLLGSGAGGTAIGALTLAELGYFGTTASTALSTEVAVIGSGGAVSGLLSGTVLAIPVVAASLYSDAAYTEMEKWTAGEKAYLGESPDRLLEEVDEWTGRTSTASRMVHGDTAVWAAARWAGGFFDPKGYEAENQRRFDETEKTFNTPQREKIWRAYFMQYANVSLTGKEIADMNDRVDLLLKRQTDKSRAAKEKLFKDVADEVIRGAFSRTIDDRVRFLRSIQSPDGTLRRQTPFQLDMADAYAELCQRARALAGRGEKTLRYVDAQGMPQDISVQLLAMGGEPTPEQARKIKDATYAHAARGRLQEASERHVLAAIRLDIQSKTGPKNPNAVPEFRAAIRKDVLAMARHHIARAELRQQEQITSGDIDKGIPYGIDQSDYVAIVTSEWHSTLEDAISVLADRAARGETTVDDYGALMKTITLLGEETPAQTFERAAAKRRLKDALKLPEGRFGTVMRAENVAEYAHDLPDSLVRPYTDLLKREQPKKQK